jgi:Pyridoxamine 5'-phosphate oxidase
MGTAMPDNEGSTSTAEGGVEINEEMDTHIGSTHRMFMVTRRKNGSVTCHPMAKFYADETVYLNMYASSAKFKNLERDSRICLLATTNSDDPEFRAAIIRGRARLLSPEETLAEDAPPGVVKARGINMEGVTKVEDAPDKFVGEDPEDWLKRAAVMVERIRDRVRVIFEIEADEVAWLEDVRKEG